MNNSESIDNNFLYGFRQLTEVALRALSPGVNDPGTAIQSLHELSVLLDYRLQNCPVTTWADDKGTVRIQCVQLSFEEVFARYILPVWDYGKDDRMVLQYLCEMLLHILDKKKLQPVQQLLAKVKKALDEKD